MSGHWENIDTRLLILPPLVATHLSSPPPIDPFATIPRFNEKFEAVENRGSLQVSRLLSSRKMAACPPCRSARSANESCPEGEKEAIEGGGDNRTEGGGLEWTRNEDRGEGGKKEEEEEEEREEKRKKRKREPPTESPTKSSATCPSRGSTQIDAHRVGF